MIDWLRTHLRVGPFFSLRSDARGDSKGGCHGRKHGDENVQYFTPKLFVFHDFLKLRIEN